MKIYTGNAFGDDLDKVEELDMGIMISSNATYKPNKEFKRVSCALDNGAFACFKKGYPFQSDVFFNTIKHCYKLNIELDFITCPDIVQGGMKSLSFSLKWAHEELLSAPKLALVVQDGMIPKRIAPDLDCFSHIFVGGSVEWKWKTAKDWVLFAHDNEMKCHIGQCGQLKYLNLARDYGADSVDSTSIQRNKSWHIIKQFQDSNIGSQRRFPINGERNVLSFV